jgi:SAM-dependent methyltransferase
VSDYVEADWYNSPLYYDLIFDQDTAVEADFIEAATVKHSESRNTAGKRNRLRILEPACGSGRLVAEFARRGHRVSGFDRNPAMLQAARKRLKTAGCCGILKTAALESFSISDSFDIAHCLLSTFKYILNEGGAVSHLQCVADHLRPGGIYLLGIHLTDYSRASCEHERWTGSNDDVHVICNTRTWPPNRRTRREQLRNRLRARHAGESRERCLETRWECRTYSANQFFRTLAKVPDLCAVAIYDFNHDIDAPKSGTRHQLRDDVVFVLRKEFEPSSDHESSSR